MGKMITPEPFTVTYQMRKMLRAPRILKNFLECPKINPLAPCTSSVCP